MTIYLRRWLPNAFSSLPGGIMRATFRRLPIWPCSVRGLPCLEHHCPSGVLLPHLFTLTRSWKPVSGGIFSVALSLGSPPLGVTQRTALWSPDFPLLPKDNSGHLTCSSKFNLLSILSHIEIFCHHFCTKW